MVVPNPGVPGASRTDAAPAVAGGGEDATVARIAGIMGGVSGAAPVGSVWIGDDAAVVDRPTGRLVLATDAAVAGVHADLLVVGPDDLGWKALAATLSDIGAMGATPAWALVTFCVPPGTDVGRLAEGVAAASARWACPVVGGDMSASSQLMVSAAVAGVLEGPEPAVLRSGGSAGDRLFVTGPLGSSAAGLRHLRQDRGAAGPPVDAHRRPLARVAEGAAARRAGASAMIDVSDGLAIDVHRLADACGVGVCLDEVPVAAGATLEEALGGGEDYELVIAAPDPAALEAVFAAEGLRAPIAVGGLTADPEERVLAGEPLERWGWEHLIG